MVLRLDLGNVLCNPFPFAQEVIVQTPDEQGPIRYYGKGLKKVEDPLGLGTKFQWKQLPNESVTVPGGTFNSTHLEGAAVAETRALLRKVDIATTADFWYTDDVPFGQVRGEVKNPNGKAETLGHRAAELRDQRRDSQITKPTKDNVGHGKLFQIFGE